MNVLERLAEVIAERRRADPGESWTAKLLSEGRERCARKFGEESIEVVLAGASGRREELVSEAADAMFHLLVLLESNGVAIEDVMNELERREGRSGIDEKASRNPSSADSTR